MAQALEMRRMEDERKHALELSKKLTEEDTTKQTLLGVPRDATQDAQNRLRVRNGIDQISSSNLSILPPPPASKHHSTFITNTAAAATANTPVSSSTMYPSAAASNTVMNNNNSAIAVNVSKARKVDYL